MTAHQRIPLVDLVTPHRKLEEELVTMFRRTLASATFVGGPLVEDFELAFAEFCGTRWCVGVGSGTDALWFALIAAGVRPGDTVVTVPNTFIATSEAITLAGALPDFVDVDAHTATMDPDKLRSYLEHECPPDPDTGRPVSVRTGRPVTAILPVHLYGQTADMDPILDLAARHELIVVEDACQAHGAAYDSRARGAWRPAGSMGRAAAFSFYPGKNLGACGEAGAITTDDEELARTCRMLRDHGQSSKYVHEFVGTNGRLDALQAGVLGVKLRHLETWNEQRRARAAEYDALLRARGLAAVVPPRAPAWAHPVYHLYVVRVPEREHVQRALTADGIATGIHYPVPLHLGPTYPGARFRPGDFPVAERAAAEVLSLPMFPELSAAQQRRVIDSLASAVEEIRPSPPLTVASPASNGIRR
jgi:dTDP-4-amino-4,6-dideoxygalactose transaminase